MRFAGITQDEGGFTLLELMTALSLLSVGFLALAGSTSLGFKNIAQGRQRAVASQTANSEIEHLRNLPYDEVIVQTKPLTNADATYPDHFVDNSDDTFGYTLKSGGPREPMYFDSVAPFNGIEHITDPFTVGTTILEIYRYVTWVDDLAITGTQDYKRVTIVVRYKLASVGGVTRMLSASSIFTPGTVTIPGSTPMPSSTPGPTASPTPSPAPTPTSSGPPGCDGDTQAPSGSFTINGGAGASAGFTASTSVSLQMSLSDTCAPIIVKFSNDGVTYGSDVTYDPLNPSVGWTLAAGEGTKTVYAKARDNANNEASLAAQTIILDTTAPTVPGTLTRTLSCSGSNRTTTLSWSTSTDTYLQGYRVYRSINNGAWTVIASVAGTTYPDTYAKNTDSVRYQVKAYDKAGNESVETNIVVLAKNQCS